MPLVKRLLAVLIASPFLISSVGKFLDFGSLLAALLKSRPEKL